MYAYPVIDKHTGRVYINTAAVLRGTAATRYEIGLETAWNRDVFGGFKSGKRFSRYYRQVPKPVEVYFPTPDFGKLYYGPVRHDNSGVVFLNRTVAADSLGVSYRTVMDSLRHGHSDRFGNTFSIPEWYRHDFIGIRGPLAVAMVHIVEPWEFLDASWYPEVPYSGKEWDGPVRSSGPTRVFASEETGCAYLGGDARLSPFISKPGEKVDVIYDPAKLRSESWPISLNFSQHTYFDLVTAAQCINVYPSGIRKFLVQPNDLMDRSQLTFWYPDGTPDRGFLAVRVTAFPTEYTSRPDPEW